MEKLGKKMRGANSVRHAEVSFSAREVFWHTYCQSEVALPQRTTCEAHQLVVPTTYKVGPEPIVINGVMGPL